MKGKHNEKKDKHKENEDLRNNDCYEIKNHLFNEEFKDIIHETTLLNKTTELKKSIYIDIDGEDRPEIDKMLNKNGYTFYTFKMIFLSFSILLIDGFHANFFSLMIIPLTGYYEFTKSNLMFLPGVIFIGNTIGSLYVGTLSKIFQRKTLIISSVGISLFFYILMILIRNILIFAISRFCIGFFIAISTTCSMGIVTEILPLQLRGLVLSCIWTGYSLGHFIMLIIMSYCMPNLDPEKSLNTMVISLIVPIFSLLVAIILTEDGPRSLIINNREKEAILILEKINRGPIEQKIIESIVKYGKKPTKVTGKYHEIFNEEYCRTTVLLLIIRANQAVISYGILAINTLTLHYLSQTEKNLIVNSLKEKENILTEEATIVFISIFSGLLSGMQIEIKHFGRKYAMFFDYIMSFIFLIASLIMSKDFSFYLSVSLCFYSMSSIVNHTYVLEVYGTKVRDSAFGILLASRKIGGFIAQIIFVYFDKISVWFPYYISCVITILNVILVYFLDKETYNVSIE